MVILKPGLGYLDKHISKLILKTVPFWNSLNVTPNYLTTLSLISSIFSLYFLYNRKLIGAIIFLLFRWYFDYLDGIYARTYNLVSKFGDYYDHITDLIYSFGIIFIIVFSKYKKVYIKYYLLIILVIFYILFLIQMGYVEREYSKINKDNVKETSISYLRKLSPNKYKYIFDAFDNSTLYIVIIIIFIIFCYYKS